VTRWINCRELVEFLDSYLAGEMDAAQSAEFENHVSQCPPCVAYMKSYRSSVALGRRVLCQSPEGAPEGMPEEMVQAILSSRQRR
jgi:anti-sigma factor RsiW